MDKNVPIFITAILLAFLLSYSWVDASVHNRLHTEYQTESVGQEGNYGASESESELEQIQHKINRLLNERLVLRFVVFLLVPTLVAVCVLYFRNKAKYAKKEASFRKVLLQRHEVLKKVALVGVSLNREDKAAGMNVLNKMNKIVYGEKGDANWSKWYESINELHGGFLDRLRQHFPQLDESECRICCLNYSGLNNKEIAVIMKRSINTVQSKKSSIRTKVEFRGHGDLTEFLRLALKDSPRSRTVENCVKKKRSVSFTYPF